jgi:hypothetical protein
VCKFAQLHLQVLGILGIGLVLSLVLIIYGQAVAQEDAKVLATLILDSHLPKINVSNNAHLNLISMVIQMAIIALQFAHLTNMLILLIDCANLVVYHYSNITTDVFMYVL